MDSDNHPLAFCTPAWWIEIFTTQPKCTYYFGPFDDAGEAETATHGYIEDLQNELAQGIKAQLNQCCQPDLLTIEY